VAGQLAIPGAAPFAASGLGTGVNREAKLLLLTQSFESWRVRRVAIRTDARNQRSRRAIEALGAHFDGVLRAARIAADGGIRDTAAYSILGAEWPERKARLRAQLGWPAHEP